MVAVNECLTVGGNENQKRVVSDRDYLDDGDHFWRCVSRPPSRLHPRALTRRPHQSLRLNKAGYYPSAAKGSRGPLLPFWNGPHEWRLNLGAAQENHGLQGERRVEGDDLLGAVASLEQRNENLTKGQWLSLVKGCCGFCNDGAYLNSR